MAGMVSLVEDERAGSIRGDNEAKARCQKLIIIAACSNGSDTEDELDASGSIGIEFSNGVLVFDHPIAGATGQTDSAHGLRRHMENFDRRARRVGNPLDGEHDGAEQTDGLAAASIEALVDETVKGQDLA